MNKKKVLSEAKTRENIMDWARYYGCEQEVILIFNKYDNLLKSCTNKEEREAIAVMGVQELHHLINSDRSPFMVGDKIIE